MSRAGRALVRLAATITLGRVHHAPRQARSLFAGAAVFNFAIAAGLLRGRPLLAPLLRLDATSGANAMLADLPAVLIAVRG